MDGSKKKRHLKDSALAVITVIALITIVLVFFLIGGYNKKFTVEFDSNGGSNVTTLKVEKNGMIQKPVDPTREGYLFEGWYLNGEKFDFNTKITGNITLEARWTKIESTTCSNVCEEGYSLNEETCECEKVDTEKLGADRTSLTLTVGGSYTIKLSIPTRLKDKTITWTSSNTNIVTVDSKGKIVAKKVGSAEVTAKVGEETIIIKVTVKQQEKAKNVLVTSISVTGSSEMNVGKSQTLKLTVSPSDASNKSVTWESSNPSVATVNGNGEVKALSEGSVTITAKAKDGSNESGSITITISSVYAVKFTAEDMSVGGPTRWQYTVTKDGKTFKDYKGFTIAGYQCTPDGERVKNSEIASRPSTATITLTNGKTVTASVTYSE